MFGKKGEGQFTLNLDGALGCAFGSSFKMERISNKLFKIIQIKENTNMQDIGMLLSSQFFQSPFITHTYANRCVLYSYLCFYACFFVCFDMITIVLQIYIYFFFQLKRVVRTTEIFVMMEDLRSFPQKRLVS